MGVYKSRSILVLAVVSLSVITAAAGPAQELPLDSWLLPFDINQRHKPPLDPSPPIPVITQDEVYEFIWQSFIALNWPQLGTGSRGQPNTQATLAPWDSAAESQGPVVWETYRKPGEVFLKPKFWPIGWDDIVPPLVCDIAGDPSARNLPADPTNYSEYASALNQPFTQAHYPTGPVVDQNKRYLRYEVTMNQSYFSYVTQFKYYRPAKQRKAVKRFIKFVEKFDTAPPPLAEDPNNAKYFQPLPDGNETYLTDVYQLPTYALQGIVEVKAAWKVLTGDDVAGRFYRRNFFFIDPDGACTGPHVAGLVALHIHRVTPSLGHIGATFEQVDNVGLQSDYGPPNGPHALPPHASLNPGTQVDAPPVYDNGYRVDGESGFRGLIPPPIPDGMALDPISERPAIDINREMAIPDDVRAANAKYRDMLKESVLFYYQLIGTQHKNLNNEPNPSLGPGIIGAQSSNTQNLINTTLESYTQRGYSCARCHLNAFPQGVSLPFPTFEEKFADLHVISFLLLNAQKN